jgi:hypothetical protein
MLEGVCFERKRMKKNILTKSITYLIIILLIILLFVIGSKLLSNHIEESKLTFHRNLQFIKLIYIISFGFIGILLGLDNLLLKLRSDGKFKLNIPKLIFWGVPLIIVMLVDTNIWIKLIPEIDMFSNYILVISSLILGYTLISSIEKHEFKD